METWTERINNVLADECSRRIAAALYWTIKSTLDSPITRKRRTPEEFLMGEAIDIVDMSDKELERARIAEEEKAWQAWEKK